MIDLLAENPLLLLFAVAALGYPLGRVRIGGFSLGVAAVLFVGLAFGALDPRLRLPDLIFVLGLVLFVYTVGLASGPGFVASFNRRGLRDNLLVVGALLFATALTAGLALVLHFPGPTAAGLFAGSLTNTPALASLIETLQRSGSAGFDAEPVVAYSISYPAGVIGVIVALFLAEKVWRPNTAREAEGLRDLGVGGERLIHQTVRVTQAAATQGPVEALRQARGWRVIFGRFRRGDQLDLLHGTTVLALGDELTVVGGGEAVREVVTALGELSQSDLAFDRSRLDYRRVFVSNPALAGKRLRDLQVLDRTDALVTRVRRGDIDMLPTPDMRLELGDRVRVVTRRDRIDEVTRFFGDSYRAVSEVDVLTFGLGIALGLLLGLVPIPLPGGVTFKLGIAGGPLLVALVLSARGRTGPIVWQLPYGANVTLRQVGLVLFLAGVGTRSGYAFASTVSSSGGLSLLLAGAAITCLASLATLVVGYRLLRIPMSLLAGLLAGQQTQPAVLAYANERTGNELPNIGWATVYPLATIAKILLAQVLMAVLPW